MTRSPIDPAFQAAYDQFDAYEADWTYGAPVELRRLYAEHRAKLSGDAADCPRSPFKTEAGLSGLLFTPKAARAGAAIVYFHGGSWTAGSAETHIVPCSHLAIETGLPVASIEYRLAPEHPFPSQREDGVAAARAAFSGAIQGFGEGLGDGLGEGLGPVDRLFLAGDSAGAAIAFWADAALAPNERNRVAGVLGFYGGYGAQLDALLGHDPAAIEQKATSDGLSTADLRAALERLGPLDALRADPTFSIVKSAPADGASCFIACGDADPLFAGSVALAERLDTIGRDAVLDVAPGLGHSYLHYIARVPAAQASLRRAADWIKRRLG